MKKGKISHLCLPHRQCDKGMKFKILKFILILFFIFILLFQNSNLIVYASNENQIEILEEDTKKDDDINSTQQNSQEKNKNEDLNLTQPNSEEKSETVQELDKSESGDEVISNHEENNSNDYATSNEENSVSNEVTSNKVTNNELIRNSEEKQETAEIMPMSITTPETITPTYLFKESILDTLDLNFINMPTVTVENKGSHIWTEVVGTHPQNIESKHQHKMLYFTSKLYNQNLDEIITVMFNNCGTLGGKPIDIKFVYSDLHTTSDTNETRDFFLSWCPYGKVETRTTVDEFFNIGFDRFNLDISFYYHGEKNPITLDNAYFTVSSLDKEENHIEATNSNEASNAYYYSNTAIERSDKEIVGGKIYTNVFKGTVSDRESKETRSVVCFEYNNKKSINFNMFSLGTAPVSFGYHVNFYSLNASISNPVKSVNNKEAYPSETLIYTIKQKMPYINNDNFEFNSFEFKDTLASCFDFNSINLEVKDYNGDDITSSCRNYQNSKWRGKL